MVRISNKQVITEVEGKILKVWSAPSSTDHGTKHYTLAVVQQAVNPEDEDDFFFLCSCKGQQYNGNCWHVEQAMEQFEQQT